MKGRIQFPLAAGIVLLAARVLGDECCQTGESEKCFYFDGNIGASLLNQTKVLDGDRIAFDVGVRTDLAVGYHLSSWAAVEFNTGVIWNSADKIGGVPLDSFGGSMDIYQIPLLGNLVLSAPSKSGFRPYIGGGVGCMATVLDFRSPLGDISDCDFAFGYQAFVGITYSTSSNLELGIGYRFSQTRDHGWDDGGVSLHTEGTATHAILASIRWKF